MIYSESPACIYYTSDIIHWTHNAHNENDEIAKQQKCYSLNSENTIHNLKKINLYNNEIKLELTLTIGSNLAHY